MIQTTRIEILHESHVDMVGRLAHGAALRLGGGAEHAEAAATAAAELAANIVKHTPGGEILLGEFREGSNCVLDLHALDKGSGISNVAACLRGSGTALTGLGAVKRIAERFQIHTRPAQGTVVWARCAIQGCLVGDGFDYGGVSVAVGGEEMCGDGWDIRESPEGLRVILTDGLGHGPRAAVASGKALSIFQRHLRMELPECLKAIHLGLAETRGAAATLASLNRESGKVTVAGVGNVLARILARQAAKSFAGDSGTLGAAVRKITELKYNWDKESVLVLHSDGISSRWDCSKYPGLEAAHPGLIAGVLYRDFRHRHDDSTVVVIRQRRDRTESPPQTPQDLVLPLSAR